MKRLKSIVYTALATLLVFLIAVPPLTASAAAVSSNVAIGTIGQTVAVSGTGFDTTYTVNIIFGKNPGTTIDYDTSRYQILRTVAVNANGSFSSSVSIPNFLMDGSYLEVTSGTYYIFCTYKSAGVNNPAVIAKTEFEILGGNLQMLPESGPVGTEITLTCMDFTGNEQVKIEFGGELLTSLQPMQATNGIISNLKVYAPPIPAGQHALTVTGQTSYTKSGKMFTITPSVVMRPKEGAASSAITLSGLGLAANSAYTLTMDNQPLRTGTTDARGSFLITFPPNTFQMGDHIFNVVDGVGNNAQIEYPIYDSSITVEPEAGGPAADVMMTGAGFKPNAEITVTFEGIGNKVTAKTDGDGSFTASFTVPWDTMGTRDITASDGENSKSIAFEVNRSGLIDPLTNASYPGNVGEVVSIAGAGFSAGRVVNVSFDGVQVPTVSIDGSQAQTVNVESNGTFTGVFIVVPPTTSGDHLIEATDGTNVIDYSFYVENIPPAQVTTVSPLSGDKVKGQPSFEWDEVDDTSGVTYTLEIATDQLFSQSSIVATEQGLTLPEFVYPGTLNSVTKDTPYYWRVQAIDNAGNAGAWSTPLSFFVGVGGSLPQWAIYVIIIGVALGFSVFTFWLGRKTAYY